MSLGGASAGAKVCIDDRNREYFEPLVEVGLGDTVNVSFGGVPPYNLTTSIYSPSSGLSACETSTELLDRNWYVWTVESVTMNGSSGFNYPKQEHEFGVLDDEVCVSCYQFSYSTLIRPGFLMALELNGTGGQHRYSGSPRYKIQAESSSASRSSIWSSKAFYLAALLVVPALLSPP